MTSYEQRVKYSEALDVKPEHLKFKQENLIGLARKDVPKQRFGDYDRAPKVDPFATKGSFSREMSQMVEDEKKAQQKAVDS